MKHFTFLFSFFLLGSCKTETIAPELIKQFTISSQQTGRTYEITVQLPEDYSVRVEPYATLYVLDAKQDDAFIGVKCNELSKEFNTQNVVVIGIRYAKSNDRSIDYTPTVTSYGQGGSLEFINFIKSELIPAVQAGYNVDTLRAKRAIIGHSFGGLFGAYAFTKHNEVFGNYLLLSPSLFYDNSLILRYEQEEREHIRAIPQLVYIGAGSTENDLLPANHILYERLKGYYAFTKSAFKLVSGLGHMSSKNIDIENALNFYFKNR